MKRSLGLLTALALAAPVAAYAQGGVGIKAGLTYGNPSQSGVAPNTSLSGYNGWTAGLSFGTASDSTPIGLRIEALYARRGVNGGSSSTDRRDFIDVPAFLEVKLPIPAVQPYLYAGPQVSYQINCSTSGSTTSCSNSSSNWSYAADVGLGVRLGGSTAVTLEGRYMYGLSDFNWGTVSSSSSYRTRQFLILAGIGF